MKNVSALENIHKHGLFGNHDSKDELINIREIKEEESIKLLNQRTNESLNILLDRKGKKIDSIKFSNLFYEQSLINKNINFFIGGSNGLKEEYHKDFDKIISFLNLIVQFTFCV